VRKIGDATAHRAVHFIVRRICCCRWNDRGSVGPLPSGYQAIVASRVADGAVRLPSTGVGGDALRI